MSTKLDQPLGDLVAANRRKNPRHRVPRKNASGVKPAVAPVGGVKKTVKPVKKVEKPSAVPTAPAKGEGKILISNLPIDVNEAQIQEYIGKTVGAIKRVMLNYGPNGKSRGVANVTFVKAASAAKAVQELNGVKVDNKPMKVEIIVDGKHASTIPEPKKFADRISAQPKPQPKPATADDKPKTAAKGKSARGRARARGGARVGRPKKTAEDLDADMKDYWVTDNAAAPEAATGGDAAMTD